MSAQTQIDFINITANLSKNIPLLYRKFDDFPNNKKKHSVFVLPVSIKFNIHRIVKYEYYSVNLRKNLIKIAPLM